MPNENGKEVACPAPGSEAALPVEASQAGSDGVTGRLPYKAPQVRSLGKVAELTFAGTGSVSDHVGVLKQTGGAH
jgi:hypothetical protein